VATAGTEFRQSLASLSAPYQSGRDCKQQSRLILPLYSSRVVPAGSR
jgi:hypothetical protein